ncbi:MAG: hypothetical protein ACIRZX_01355 [Lactobacillus crispatus]
MAIDHILFDREKYIKQTADVKQKLDNYDSLNQWKKNAEKSLDHIKSLNGNLQSRHLHFNDDGTLIYDLIS